MELDAEWSSALSVRLQIITPAILVVGAMAPPVIGQDRATFVADLTPALPQTGCYETAVWNCLATEGEDIALAGLLFVLLLCNRARREARDHHGSKDGKTGFHRSVLPGANAAVAISVPWPKISRVMRRLPILIERLLRSTNDVLTCLGSGLPSTRYLCAPVQMAGL